MIDKTACVVSYQGGEGQSVFPIPFPFQENSHIHARVRGADKNETILAAGVDFTVNSISDSYGELVLLGPALAEGNVLAISRRLPLTQEILFHNQGPNSPSAVEEAVDKLTMISQQLQADLDDRLAASPEGSVQGLDEVLAAVEDVRQRLGGKAAAVHSHIIADVGDLTARLAAKADTGHNHALTEVAGLEAALAGKLAALPSHAARHIAGGSDAIAPEDIGVLPAPPGNGKTYLATGGGWVEYVAPGGGEESGEGVGTMDHAQLLNRDAADQHPQSAIQHLPRDLEAVRLSLAGLLTAQTDLEENLADLDGKAESAVTRLNGHDGEIAGHGSRLGGLDSAVAALNASLSGLGAMAQAADAPRNGKPHLRQDGGWTEYAAPTGSSGGGATPGEIRLLPFRAGELPSGWYFCNGDRFALASAPGAALNALSAAFKTDWGIGAADGSINLPNLFSAGVGYFLRAVDNAARLPGAVQGDAIRNIVGEYNYSATIGSVLSDTSQGTTTLSGAFHAGAFSKGNGFTRASYGDGKVADLLFDASRCVPVADEIRPMNIGMTPAIYLGAYHG